MPHQLIAPCWQGLQLSFVHSTDNLLGGGALGLPHCAVSVTTNITIFYEDITIMIGIIDFSTIALGLRAQV